MKLKRLILLAAVAAMGLMLGPGAAQAVPVVERDGETGTATAIRDLEVGGILYDVEFVNQSSATLYGDPPTFDFTTLADARAAVDAANAALNEETGITDVGESSATGVPVFRVGFGVTGDGALRATQIWGSSKDGDGTGDFWIRAFEPDFYPFIDDGSFADFIPLEDLPPPEGEIRAGLSKVAEQDEILADTSVLREILISGGVAVNLYGNVAFAGRNETAIDAAFTQERLVVKEGDTLPDDSILTSFRALGEVAMSASQSGDRLAFHGKDQANTDSVFTQDGVVAAEGQALPDDTVVDEINDDGKVAINDFGVVAFHGKIEVEEGLFDERLRAVFTSEMMIAREGLQLPDGVVLDQIKNQGGVAIDDFGDVVFHGDGIDNNAVDEDFEAVFNQAGVVVREGETLADTTVLESINEDGGIAVNVFGQVAFHGDALVGADSVRAVFTQGGVVIKEGDILGDGTVLDEINANAGVSINLYGQVAFHGRTGGVKAVFTQAGVVAKVGDILPEGGILTEISDTGGVAINTFGQVAFHGLVDNSNTVMMGQASF